MLCVPIRPLLLKLNFNFSRSLILQNIEIRMSMVEVSVPNLDCEGCASKLRKTLFKLLKGVEEVEIDMEIQKVTVRGGYALEEKRVLKAIRGAGKTAEPWPPYPFFDSIYQYHYFTSKNVDDVPHIIITPAEYSEEAVTSLFSDDNPHACTIM